MKQLVILALLAIMTTTSSTAQSIAVVDINDVLTSFPDYRKAEAELDKVANNWRQEIAEEYDKIKALYNKYQAETPLLTEEMKMKRENEIIAKEESVRALQTQRFGPDGDLFTKRQELVAPVQERVYEAIDDFASDRGVDLIFDKSGAAGLLYASEQYDKTTDIKKRLGIK